MLRLECQKGVLNIWNLVHQYFILISGSLQGSFNLHHVTLGWIWASSVRDAEISSLPLPTLWKVWSVCWWCPLCVAGWFHTFGSSFAARPWPGGFPAAGKWHEGKSSPSCPSHRSSQGRHEGGSSAPAEWPQRWCGVEGQLGKATRFDAVRCWPHPGQISLGVNYFAAVTQNFLL